MRIKPARPPGTIATFSQEYWLSLPWRCISLYIRATAARRGLMPAVGPYSLAAIETSMCVGRGNEPSMSSSTSGAPWPRLAHSSGSSRNPCSAARSVHHTTPVDARVASRPAWGRCPGLAARNCLWIFELVSAKKRRQHHISDSRKQQRATAKCRLQCRLVEK